MKKHGLKELPMAGIDKTYTDSYKDYKEFKDWADTQTITFYNGLKVCVGSWVWNLTEEDFAEGEHPIMNTPTWLDTHLIQNCKVKFVLDRMKEVYGQKQFSILKKVDLSAPPSEGYEQNRKIVITRCERTKFPLHPKPYGGKGKWWLQCEDDLWYNDETKTWARLSHYPTNTNTATITTVKALVRHLRKQYLPKGAKFTLSGKYVGEEYIIYTK